MTDKAKRVVHANSEDAGVTAGEVMEPAPEPTAKSGLSPEDARELAARHQQAVCEGRERVGEAPCDSGQNAKDHRGTIHPSAPGHESGG